MSLLKYPEVPAKAVVRLCAVLALLVISSEGNSQPDAAHATRPPTRAAFATTGTLADVLDLDPAIMYAPLIPERATLEDTSLYPDEFVDFYRLLQLHNTRYGEDDNFTLRVFDTSSRQVLERYVLTEERAAFLATGSASWDKVDRKRRQVMRRLLKKYEARGYKRSKLTVTWGRLNQVFQARERSVPFLSYELRLANMHRLSTLATALSTVETFNQDWLTSKAGARGRYQFMPDFVRRFELRRFKLASTNGAVVWVREERHPLLTMEYAFMIMRAYANTVGHEIPGLSAYNAGVGNIFNICRLYLMRERPNPSNTTVFDAYSWAVTTGFSEVKRRTTFRRQSRAYVPSIVAAYRAVEDLPIDLSRTMQAELVTMRHGSSITLGSLLETLKTHDLDWTPYETFSPYEAFRSFNGHINLPAGTASGKIPRGGNVKLKNPSRKLKLRFFLPLGSAEILKAAGKDVFDDSETRVFDENTFADPEITQQKSLLDWEYERIVDEIGNFGFTLEIRERVSQIAEQMEALAKEKPTPYRRSQSIIANMHKRLWSFGPWVKLEQAVAQIQNIHDEYLRQGAPPKDPDSSDD